MAKSGNKTKPTLLSVNAFMASIEDEKLREDCSRLAGFMERITGFSPVMWGEAIVGFGSYRYKYDSGREGDSCLTGFSPRKQNISIYTNCSLSENDILLSSLGKFKAAKSCIYIKKLDDIDIDVLGKIILASINHLKKIYP